MKIATPKRLKLLGWFFLVTASAIAYLWFYWFAPMRHLHDPDWWQTRSMREIWIEEQKQIHRTGVDHDSSIAIGEFGDKKWTEWVIRQLNSRKLEEEMRSCDEWPYHLEEAMCRLTNQHMTNNDAWLVWWEKNKDKSQEDWIREGFAQIGLILQSQLTTNNIIDLLKLSHSSTNFTFYTNKIGNDARSGYYYNALRWLRDSDFRWYELKLETIPSESRNGAAIALMSYAEWVGETWNSPGKLSIEKHYGEAQRGILSGFSWIIYLSLLLLPLGGIGLLVCSHHKTRTVDK